VNRVHELPKLSGERAVLEAELAQHLPDFPAAAELGAVPQRNDLLTRMLAAAEDARALAQRDHQGLERLRKAIGHDLPYVEVPAFDRDVHDLGALERLSHHLAQAT
jgi:hypothetical protein